MRRVVQRLWERTDGAVAPTVALSLVGLIAAGGIAFDYARMASLDTELQSAADQAALAAASQLDGNDGACARAAAAAAGMVANRTLMANDGNASGRAINVQNEATCDATGKIRFYQDIGKSKPATTDAEAKFVEVEVDPRQANFALTPIAAAYNSGPMKAVAFAGMQSAVCKVPPLMMCNPNETGDPNFTIANYVGKGIRLVANDGGGIYGPGNFGFLATGLDTSGVNGAKVLRQVLGLTSLAEDCVSGDGVTTDPGNMVSVRDALNTRFDIYDSGLQSVCGNDGSSCPPSINTRKDVVQQGNACTLADNSAKNPKGWTLPAKPYPGATLPSEGELTDAQAQALSPTGYPHDICHSFTETGDCVGGRIGDGHWDRYAYFESHPIDYPGLTTRALVDAFMLSNFKTTTPTRYQVYSWEMQSANKAARLHTNVNVNGMKASSQPVCTPPGITPGATAVDRRVLTVAVVNCATEGVKGKTKDVGVTKWVDIFLTEPSMARTAGTPTENSDVYVEMIGQTKNATDEGAVQLVKKSVPYLIE
ncbi:MAG TPA: pilus assembly protein TadG-related protein [Sphingomicrobium sp.]|nr:pilus assembly protein TadG-related protein [Sphingomicrobium sp.]